MANEVTKAEEALQRKVDALTEENTTLKTDNGNLQKDAKAKDDEIKKLKDADAKSSTEIGALKEKISTSDSDLKTAKKEFEDYKTEHEGSVKESTDLIIKKREEIQAIIKNREILKEAGKKFMDLIDKTLK
jgi:chromosome segregation ATPase